MYLDLNDNIKQRKFTLEDANNMFGLKIFKRNNVKLRLQNLAKDALKTKYPHIFDKDKPILVLDFASLWNGNEINLAELRQQQTQYLQRLEQQLIQKLSSSKKGGNKHRKMTVIYRKKRHQNKKKTYKKGNKKLTKKNRFIKK